MARFAKITITDNNYEIALEYLQKKIASNDSWFNDDYDNYDYAKRSFSRASNTADSLNKWAEKYLIREDWVKLRNVINKRLSRQNNAKKHIFRHDKQMTLKLEAKMMIKLLAQVHGMDYSQYLIAILENKFNKMNAKYGELSKIEPDKLKKIQAHNRKYMKTLS